MDLKEATRTRWFSALGLAASALLFLDLAVVRTAARGRDAFAQFVGRPGGLAVVGLSIALAVLCGHATLGLRRSVRGELPSGHPDESVRSLQRLLGLAAAPFVVARLVGSPLGASVVGLDGFGLHQALRDRVGHPVSVAIHCIGVAAVAVHLYQGLVAFGVRRGLSRHAPIAFLVASAYAVLWLDVLAYLVTGRALLRS